MIIYRKLSWKWKHCFIALFTNTPRTKISIISFSSVIFERLWMRYSKRKIIYRFGRSDFILEKKAATLSTLFAGRHLQWEKEEGKHSALEVWFPVVKEPGTRSRSLPCIYNLNRKRMPRAREAEIICKIWWAITHPSGYEREGRISNGITGSNIVAMFVVGLVIFFLNNTILLKIQVENQSQMFLEARNYIGSM